jgi:hypothetical protein
MIIPSSRLIGLQGNLKDLYEQLGGQEKALVLAPNDDKVRVRQKIRETEAEIQYIQQKYWIQLSQELVSLPIPEKEAEVLIAAIIQKAEAIETATSYHAQVEQKLEKLLTEVKKPEITAAGKLKAAIPLLPGFITYEVELDTEGLLQGLFPTFCKLLGKK